MLPIWKGVQMVAAQKASILSLRLQLTLSFLFSFLNQRGFFKLLITIFNSIILLSCCYLEVQSSLGELSEAARGDGFSAASLLRLRVQPNARLPSPGEEPKSVRASAPRSRGIVALLSAGPQWPSRWVVRGPRDSHGGEATPRGERSLSAA